MGEPYLQMPLNRSGINSIHCAPSFGFVKSLLGVPLSGLITSELVTLGAKLTSLRLNTFAINPLHVLQRASQLTLRFRTQFE
jgi:hypothetical protein